MTDFGKSLRYGIYVFLMMTEVPFFVFTVQSSFMTYDHYIINTSGMLGASSEAGTVYSLRSL